MTTHPPETQEQPPGSNGQHGDGGVTGAGLAEPRDERPITTPRPSPAPDYRLRGLALDDARTDAEVPAGPVRTAHRSRRRRRRLLVQWVVVLTLTATVAMLLRASVFGPYSVSSASMVPTLQAGTDVLVVKPSLLAGSIKAGRHRRVPPAGGIPLQRRWRRLATTS